jgi:hypothetical protein
MRLTKVRCIVLFIVSAGVLVTTFALALDHSSDPYRTWVQPGLVQAFAGRNEVWLFVDMERWVHIPGRFVSAPNRPVSSVQQVIVVDRNGVKRRISVSVPYGDIFHFKDRFFLYQGPSATTDRCVFEWDEDHFELLPRDGSEALLEAGGLREVRAGGLEQLTNADGWNRLLRERWGSPARTTFEWDEHTFALVIQQGDSATAELYLRCTSPKRAWDVVVAEYDTAEKTLTRGEADQLFEKARETRQRGHPRND